MHASLHTAKGLSTKFKTQQYLCFYSILLTINLYDSVRWTMIIYFLLLKIKLDQCSETSTKFDLDHRCKAWDNVYFVTYFDICCLAYGKRLFSLKNQHQMLHLCYYIVIIIVNFVNIWIKVKSNILIRIEYMHWLLIRFGVKR